MRQRVLRVCVRRRGRGQAIVRARKTQLQMKKEAVGLSKSKSFVMGRGEEGQMPGALGRERDELHKLLVGYLKVTVIRFRAASEQSHRDAPGAARVIAQESRDDVQGCY